MSFSVRKTKKFSIIDIPQASSLTNSITESKNENNSNSTSAATHDSFHGQSGSFSSDLEERARQKYEIIRAVGEECIQEDELLSLLRRNEHPIVYDGFEPSGRMHIAQGVFRAINVNKLTRCGCRFKFWVADWFAMLNNKMNGDLSRIRTVGLYMIEIWKAIGMDMTSVEFLWASEHINQNSNSYWTLVMNIARTNTISRIQRCCTIMGREEGLDSPAAQIMYPCMQTADIFLLKADICQLGMDQRKVNMLAREFSDELKNDAEFRREYKPIILSHHMLLGLLEGQEKMSKSQPDSAIFMEDSESDVKRKIKQAYCPPQVIEKNPILDYCQHIIFSYYGSLRVERKFGEAVEYCRYVDLERDYLSGAMHPGDLKPAVAKAINNIIEPVRVHFSSGYAKDLMDQVKSFKVTR